MCSHYIASLGLSLSTSENLPVIMLWKDEINDDLMTGWLH